MTKQDQHTYRRGLTAALIGLGSQSVIWLLVAGLGLYTSSAAVSAEAWHLVAGVPLWVILAVLFNQQRLERLESLEAQRLASRDAASQRLFDEAGQQLAQAQSRLATIRKWALPAVTLGTALYLLAVGGLLLWSAWSGLNADGPGLAAFREGINLGLTVGTLSVAAIAAFLVARYIAGMTEVNAWEPLRGGAGFLMGNAVLLALLAASFLAAYAGVAWPLAAMSLLVPAVMVLLGIEFCLALLLSIYRPRRADEQVRPAFDSRVLGWLTRPESIGKIVGETLNYQFGFEVSRSWFYQLAARAALPLLVATLLVLWAMTSVVVVLPQQNAVITTNGRLVKVAPPGLTFKAPWPFGRAVLLDVNRLHQVMVGTRQISEEDYGNTPMLWTNQHGVEAEAFLITAPPPTNSPTNSVIASGADGGTDDGTKIGEMIGADVVVKYRIADPKAYVTSAESPEAVLKVLAQREVNALFATKTVPELLSAATLEAGAQLQERVSAAVDARHLGLEVVLVSVSGVHPPQDNGVADKFHEVVAALQEKETSIARARQDEARTLATVAGSVERAMEIEAAIERGGDDAEIEELLTRAGGEAAQRLLAARGYRWERAVTARAEGERFNAEVASYEAAPSYYKARLYLDALADALSTQKKTIIDADGTPLIRLEMKPESTGLQSVLSGN